MREGNIIVARFLAKIQVEVRVPVLGPCWIWTGATLGSRSVYGSFAGKKDGKPWPRYAHKLAWEWTHGLIPAPLKACHRCDVMLCVNPSHLFLGTQKDNLDDARRKGRLVDGIHARTLSDAAYRDILSTPDVYGAGVAAARRHGVSETTISRIRHRHQGSTFHASLQNVEPVSESVESLTESGYHLDRLQQQFRGARLRHAANSKAHTVGSHSPLSV
jgi:hypothetical protein